MKSDGMKGQRDRTSVVRVKCPKCLTVVGTLYPEERPAEAGEASTSRTIMCPTCQEPRIVHTVPRKKAG